MTFWKSSGKLASALGIGLVVLAAGACAQARPAMVTDGRPLMAAGAGYELQVLVDGVPAPTFFHGGGTYVMGQLGQRYTLRIVNHTARRIEAVVSVDGRDVVDGRGADYRSKRGYLVPAYGSVDIDGWRLSQSQVAAFRFSTVADSYAARIGSSREVGVIGAAIFPERPAPRPIYPYRRPLDLPYDYGMRGSPAPSGSREKSVDDDTLGGVLPGQGNAAPRAEAPSAGAPAPSSPSRSLAEAESRRRPGLGTEFGEAVGSSVREVSFVRANASAPSVVLGARYNDREGLVALGIDVEPDHCYAGWGCDRDLELRQTANPFPVTQRRYAAPPPCWNGRTCR
jgi:hypothetical protein